MGIDVTGVDLYPVNPAAQLKKTRKTVKIIKY